MDIHTLCTAINTCLIWGNCKNCPFNKNYYPDCRMSLAEEIVAALVSRQVKGTEHS